MYEKPEEILSCWAPEAPRIGQVGAQERRSGLQEAILMHIDESLDRDEVLKTFRSRFGRVWAPS